MIPILLLVGALAGRWYVVGLAAVVWPLVLVIAGVTSDPASLAGGAALGAANAAVGVAIHRTVAWTVRAVVAAATARTGGGRST